tara:strand:+ start:655 stop:1722 length:1068 start_codon:yes stop_codon:yes gene_type:complete
MPVPIPPPPIEFKPYIGIVTADGVRDHSLTGKLEVTLVAQGINADPVIAHSIMPWGGRGHGAFGPVEPMSEVMLLPVQAQPSNRESSGIKWYWIGVLPNTDFVAVEPHEKSASDSNESNLTYGSTLPSAKEIYAVSKIPTKTVIKTQVGHKLELAETVYETPNEQIRQDDYAMLTTNSGKHIKLDAGVGPAMDRIIITDEKDNRIVIKTGDDKDTDPGWGPESITIECTGNMHLLSKTGEMDVRVGPESTSNITIQNEGTGDIITRCDKGNIYIVAEKDVIVQSENAHVTTKNHVTVNAGGNITATTETGNADINCVTGTVTATTVLNLLGPKVNFNNLADIEGGVLTCAGIKIG